MLFCIPLLRMGAVSVPKRTLQLSRISRLCNDRRAVQWVGQRRNLEPRFPGFIFRKYKDVPFPAEYVTTFFSRHDKPELQKEIMQEKRTWNEEQRLRYLRGHQATGRFSNNKRKVPNTLEQKIMDILDHLATVKPKWDNPEWFDSPSLGVRFQNLESALSAAPVYLTVGEKFREFRRAHDSELNATVLLSQANMMVLGVFLETK